MTNEKLAVVQPSAETLEQVIVKGDLSSMNPAQKVSYYQAVCSSLGLNYLTKPFSYIKLNGELQLYVNRTATDQLRKIYGVSIKIVSREIQGELYIVTAQAWMPDGRIDESTGVVDIKGKAGDFLSNQMMKCESKAKRRVTLSLIGLGWMSADEAESTGGELVSDEEPEKKQVQQITKAKDFKCSESVLLSLRAVIADAEELVTVEEMRRLLPKGCKSTKELNDPQALKFIETLTQEINERREAKRSEEEAEA